MCFPSESSYGDGNDRDIILAYNTVYILLKLICLAVLDVGLILKWFKTFDVSNFLISLKNAIPVYNNLRISSSGILAYKV